MLCQRWREQHDTYRPAGEPIDTARYGVEILEKAEARPFVERHHYAGSYPSHRLAVGLRRVSRGGLDELCGVAVFSHPCNNAVITSKAAALHPTEGVVLSRFVLLDDVPANGETWFLGRAFRILAGSDWLKPSRPSIKLVIADADPLPRRNARGRLVKPGHIGTIYQAFNGAYIGRSKPETIVLDRLGKTVHRRTLSKLRNGETGAGGAYQQLLDRGAPPIEPGESPKKYTERVMSEGVFRRVRHPGNHQYLWPIGPRRLTSGIRDQFPRTQSFPKRGRGDHSRMDLQREHCH